MAKIYLKTVRLSFPSLFKKSVFQGVESKKYEATFLINKDTQADQIKAVEKEIKDFILQTFGEGKAPKALKITCFQDGDTKDYDGYENHMALKASTSRRPLVIDKDKSPIVEEDNVVYAGCYVNSIISLWFSDHPTGGKQILANLEGVQFVKDGASFGDAGVSADAFDAFGSDDEEDFI